MPAAKISKAVRKKGNDGIFAAGYTRRHAATIVLRPTMMARLYPIQSMILADGNENTKEAKKNAVWIKKLSARFRLKTFCAKGIRTSFNEVSEPHTKNSVVNTVRAGP